MPRIANFKIDAEIRKVQEFVNYNNTITATTSDAGLYTITHWGTTILEYNIHTHEIQFLLDWKVSQTTSTLVGRILRSLPTIAVERFLAYYSPSPVKQRLVRMLHIR